VTTILSNRNKAKKPVVIKADMTKDERKVESIPLQECWKLIQQGTNCKHITIRRSEIYVGKLLHAKVINQKLVLCRSPEETTDTNTASSTSAEAEMEHAEACLININYSPVPSRLSIDCNLKTLNKLLSTVKVYLQKEHPYGT